MSSSSIVLLYQNVNSTFNERLFKHIQYAIHKYNNFVAGITSRKKYFCVETRWSIMIINVIVKVHFYLMF